MQTNDQAVGSFSRDQRLAVLARRLFCLLFAILFPCLYGCKPNKRYDLIEAELRTRERELTDTRAALEQARNLNKAFAQQATVGAEPVSPSAPVYVPVK